MKNLNNKELLEINGGDPGFRLPWWLTPLEDWLMGEPEVEQPQY
ncbi:hypothetical protein [Aquimarina pacifica]|nr:hypothetical protein [Aquimarina pacifica]